MTLGLDERKVTKSKCWVFGSAIWSLHPGTALRETITIRFERYTQINIEDLGDLAL